MKQSNIKPQDLLRLKKGALIWIQEPDSDGVLIRVRAATDRRILYRGNSLI